MLGQVFPIPSGLSQSFNGLPKNLTVRVIRAALKPIASFIDKIRIIPIAHRRLTLALTNHLLNNAQRSAKGVYNLPARPGGLTLFGPPVKSLVALHRIAMSTECNDGRHGQSDRKKHLGQPMEGMDGNQKQR